MRNVAAAIVAVGLGGLIYRALPTLDEIELRRQVQIETEIAEMQLAQIERAERLRALKAGKPHAPKGWKGGDS